MGWLNASDALRTDWIEERVQDRPRRYCETVATIPCGLRARSEQYANPDGTCRDRFFTPEGRDLHRMEDHEQPFVWRPNPLSGRMQKVRWQPRSAGSSA